MYRKHVIFFSIFFTLFIFSYASSQDIIRVVHGTVVSVSDGDTFQMVTSNGTKLKVRCFGYDAPERERINRKTGLISKPGQPFGEEAYRALATKIDGKDVKIEIVNIDHYRRMVALVYSEGRVINWEMVREGFGECYREYLEKDSDFLRQCNAMEFLARKEKRGIWSLKNYEKPSEFRKRHKRN